jgi:hypothetical protein
MSDRKPRPSARKPGSLTASTKSVRKAPADPARRPARRPLDPFALDLLRELLDPYGVFTWVVPDNSMAPEYRLDDRVVFGASAPRNDDVCLVRFADGGLRLRRIFFRADRDGVAGMELRRPGCKPKWYPAASVTGFWKPLATLANHGI